MDVRMERDEVREILPEDERMDQAEAREPNREDAGMQEDGDFGLLRTGVCVEGADVHRNAIRYSQFKVSGVTFECPVRYALIKAIGKGAYGLVCSADDLASRERVAIKRIGNAFDNPLDARRTLREVQLLRRLRHENVVALRNVYPPADLAAFTDVYCVYDLLDTDLHQLIRSPQLLNPPHVRFMAYQMMRALKYLHSAGVVHRDLKPSNLLLNANGDLKLCDFGLARTGVGSVDLMPEYIVTRWYRAPELLLSCTGYGAPIDMWSAGCILAEMLGRKPLFPGREYIHTLNLVCRVVGSPSEADVAAVPSDHARRYLASMPRFEPADLAACFPDADPLAVDLIRRLLAFNPARRLTAAAALAHPYFAPLHDPADEPTAPHPLPLDRELDALPVTQVREAIFQEMLAFNPRLAHYE